MQSGKLISILTILILLSGFIGFETIRKSDKYVIGIVTPTVIQIDLNGNKAVDNNETICISQVETLTSKLTVNQDELIKNLKISNTDAIKLGYLTDNFSEVFYRCKIPILILEACFCMIRY